MAFLPAKPFDLRDRHALEAFFGEGVFHLVEFERLNDGFDLFHDTLQANSYLLVIVYSGASLSWYPTLKCTHRSATLSRGPQLSSRHIRHGFVLRVCEHPELGDVEAFKLHLFADAQWVEGVHQREHHVGEAEHVDYHQRGSAKLRQELPVVSIEQAGYPLASLAEIRRRADTVPAGAVGAIGKEADTDGAQPAAVPVHRDGPTGVVDLEHALIAEDPQADEDAGQNADDDRGVWRHKRAGRRNGNQ